jgi:hypothetical protein
MNGCGRDVAFLAAILRMNFAQKLSGNLVDCLAILTWSMSDRRNIAIAKTR